MREPIGKQDQYIAAYGGLTCFTFNPDDTVEAVPLRVDTDTLFDLEPPSSRLAARSAMVVSFAGYVVYIAYRIFFTFNVDAPIFSAPARSSSNDRRPAR